MAASPQWAAVIPLSRLGVITRTPALYRALAGPSAIPSMIQGMINDRRDNMKAYDLKETLNKLSPHPDGYTPANLASLCRDGQITPLFPYSLYISKAIDTDDEGAPIYTPGDVAKFDGYLTHDNLISLLDGYNDAIELEEATICEFNEGHLTKGDTARLLARPFQYIKYASGDDDYDSADPFTIERDRLVFAASEVERYYLTSYCFDDVSAPGALLEEAQATIKEQRQRIEQLEAELAGKIAQSDDKDLRPNSQAKVADMLYALLTAHNYELTPEGKGKTNDIIVSASKQHGTPVVKNFVAGWLKRAYQLSIDTDKTK